MRVALYPGSFDPFTLGHLDIVSRGRGLFDRLVIGVGRNPAKGGLVPVDLRVQWIEQAVEEARVDGVSVVAFEGLTADCAQDVGAGWILRGLRGAGDLGEEGPMAATNRAISGIDTVFLGPHPPLAHVQSRLVRQISVAGGDVSSLVPPVVARGLAGLSNQNEGKET